ncbi:serine-protein kinase ATM [Nephila pilipes]|uniref:Serine-protein kinase ATM n=1 Tax=Nephila pilipes TaxID=299642 RepID=A0A8X6MNV9_NEPPI|nr:serine-protein kinase ATM [Nephila pilipes]
MELKKKRLEKLCSLARMNEDLEVASNALHVLRQLPNVEEEDILCWQVEEAKILWTKKEYSVANKILKSTLPDRKVSVNADKDPADKREVTDKLFIYNRLKYCEERMNAAKKLLSILLKTKISHLVKSYTDLCDAYISLAYLTVPKNLKKGVIPKDQPLLKFQNLQDVPVITEELKVDHTCEYKHIVGIHSFHNEFRMCGCYLP